MKISQPPKSAIGYAKIQMVCFSLRYDLWMLTSTHQSNFSYWQLLILRKILCAGIPLSKRGVNKKVLKVPSIEQKVLDATSNETWGNHGSLLADIALASRN